MDWTVHAQILLLPSLQQHRVTVIVYPKLEVRHTTKAFHPAVLPWQTWWLPVQHHLKFTINGGLTLGTGWDVSYIQINGGVTSASQTNDDIALTNAMVYGSVDLSDTGIRIRMERFDLKFFQRQRSANCAGEINGCYITSDGNGINLVNGFILMKW